MIRVFVTDSLELAERVGLNAVQVLRLRLSCLTGVLVNAVLRLKQSLLKLIFASKIYYFTDLSMKWGLDEARVGGSIFLFLS